MPENRTQSGILKPTQKPVKTPKQKTEQQQKPTVEPTTSLSMTVPVQTPAPSVTPAAKPSFVVSSDNNGLNVAINNNPVNFTDVKPFIDENNRTLLPVRAVMESMNCSVDYDDMTKTVTIKGKDVDMTLKIGENTIVVDGKVSNMEYRGTDCK